MAEEGTRRWVPIALVVLAVSVVGLGMAWWLAGMPPPGVLLGNEQPIALFTITCPRCGEANGAYEGKIRVYKSGIVMVETVPGDERVEPMRGQAQLPPKSVARLLAALPAIGPTARGNIMPTGTALRACLQVGTQCYGFFKAEGALKEAGDVYVEARDALEAAGVPLRSPPSTAKYRR